MGLVIILGGLGLIAGVFHAIWKNDEELGMVIIKGLLGCMGGLALGVLLLVAALRGLDL